MRYKLEQLNDNSEWKTWLGLRTIENEPLIIRYKAIFINQWTQIIIVLIIFLIQIIVGQTTKSYVKEQIPVIIILEIELLAIIWLLKSINLMKTQYYFKEEVSRQCILSQIVLVFWCMCCIIYGVADIDFIWSRLSIILMAIWLCMYCYFETIWILKQADTEWSYIYFKEALPDSVKYENHVSMKQVLSIQDGFEALMRFLVKEFSCDNLLAFVELTQFINRWSPTNIRYKPLIWGYSRMIADEYSIVLPDDVVFVMIYYYKLLYADYGYGHEKIEKIAYRKDVEIDRND